MRYFGGDDCCMTALRTKDYTKFGPTQIEEMPTMICFPSRCLSLRVVSKVARDYVGIVCSRKFFGA
jgi:hypothetical protein